MSAGETEVGERERERDRYTDRSGERERYGGKERKIETQTGVGERERERHGGREKDRRTDKRGERDMVVLSFSLPPYLPLSPTPVCVSIFLSLLPYLSQLCFNFNNYLIS